MARSFGAAGVRVEHPDEIGDALSEALASGKPYLVESPIDPAAKPPAVGSWEPPPLPPFKPNLFAD